MRVHSAAGLAAIARSRRHDLHLSQSELARRADVSRKWVSQFEAGKTSAELALVIRVLESLDLRLGVEPETTTGTPAQSAEAALSAWKSTHPPAGSPVDLDEVLAEYGG